MLNALLTLFFLPFCFLDGVARTRRIDYEVEWHTLTRSLVCILVEVDGGSVSQHANRKLFQIWNRELESRRWKSLIV